MDTYPSKLSEPALSKPRGEQVSPARGSTGSPRAVNFDTNFQNLRMTLTTLPRTSTLRAGQ